MNTRTVKSGLNLIIAGIVAITLATFFNNDVTQLLSLTVSGQKRFIALGLFCGGLCSGLGIMIALAGVLRSGTDNRVRLARTILVLVAAIALFFALFFRSINSPHQPPLRPGETIII
ncbi:hypothetical protein [Geobacter sp. AOG1]|uniref:hypothetical protein n=1 Tax=Geobacter sp. AOG1 TaxID=1566346 RepID=UPI001CC822CB|nr:hypothetical protein [Geobacter sp. AOG1]GFE58924.1 hypothetical protein AOG1_28040 [Geobacter sp. AOG1]